MDPQPPEGFVPADLGPGFGARFGPVFLDRSRGLIGFRVADQHLNAIGTCHGGAMTTFADTQLMAVRAGAEEGGPHSPTVNLTIDFLAPSTAGAWLQAEVALLRESRSLYFTQALMTVDGQPVARSSAIYRKYKPQGE